MIGVDMCIEDAGNLPPVAPRQVEIHVRIKGGIDHERFLPCANEVGEAAFAGAPHLDDPRAGNRYAGHCAEILQERGSLARVAVWPPGKSQAPNVRPATMWIDLASSEQCDAGPDSLTTIGVGGAPKLGALFLISGHLE